MYEKFGTDKKSVQAIWLKNWVNIETIKMYKLIIYTSKNVILISSDEAYLDDPENKKANTGHASAKV